MSHDTKTGDKTSRRTLLIGAAAAAALSAAPLVVQAAKAKAALKRPREKMWIAWLPAGTCYAPVPVALAKGFFDKYDLDVELVNYRLGFKSPTHQMITAPARGEADAVVAMVYNFMRPIAEDGVKLKFVTAIHGGCVRVVGSKAAGVTTLESLKGKTLAVPGELRGEDAIQLFPALLRSWGLRPEKDIFLLWGPDRQNPEVVRSGKAQAYMQVDPIIFSAQRNNPDLVEIINNQTGPFADKTCCVVAASDDYIDKHPLALPALHFALKEAGDYIMQHPDEAAALFAKESTFDQGDIAGSLKRMDHHVHNQNMTLEKDIAFQARALRDIGGFQDVNFDTDAFAKRATASFIC
jgi:NitT/TauT family transport system substrate-binding protein